jgi:hypothetical protein
MFMVYNTTEFHVSSDSNVLVITIKQKPIENRHRVTTLFFAFHKNSTLKKAENFLKLYHHMSLRSIMWIRLERL